MRERGIILMLVTLLLLTPSITLAETGAEETDIVYPEDVGGGPGDIVLIAYNLPECLGSKWGHAQIYLGSYSINDGDNTGDGNFADADRHKVVEATFYSCNWGLFCKFRYYWIAFRVIMGWGIGPCATEFLKKLQQRTYSGEERKWGGVEINSLHERLIGKWDKIWGYCYGRVNMSKVGQSIGKNISEKDELSLRKAAMNYAIQRANKIWPRLGYTEEVPERRSSRPFDYLSPWYYDSKQMDEFTVEQVNQNHSLAKTPDYGYYCSELVWAAWMHAGKEVLGKPIDLDGDNTTKAVFPWDIYKSDLVDWYYIHTKCGSTDPSNE